MARPGFKMSHPIWRWLFIENLVLTRKPVSSRLQSACLVAGLCALRGCWLMPAFCAWCELGCTARFGYQPEAAATEKCQLSTILQRWKYVCTERAWIFKCHSLFNASLSGVPHLCAYFSGCTRGRHERQRILRRFAEFDLR